jgi:hypothetical protein
MAMQAEPEAYAEFVEELSALTMATTERGLSTMAMGPHPTHKIPLVRQSEKSRRLLLSMKLSPVSKPKFKVRMTAFPPIFIDSAQFRTENPAQRTKWR